jgi:hypothetical protein
VVIYTKEASGNYRQPHEEGTLFALPLSNAFSLQYQVNIRAAGAPKIGDIVKVLTRPLVNPMPGAVRSQTVNMHQTTTQTDKEQEGPFPAKP